MRTHTHPVSHPHSQKQTLQTDPRIRYLTPRPFSRLNPSQHRRGRHAGGAGHLRRARQDPPVPVAGSKHRGHGRGGHRGALQAVRRRRRRRSQSRGARAKGAGEREEEARAGVSGPCGVAYRVVVTIAKSMLPMRRGDRSETWVSSQPSLM